MGEHVQQQLPRLRTSLQQALLRLQREYSLVFAGTSRSLSSVSDEGDVYGDCAGDEQSGANLLLRILATVVEDVHTRLASAAISRGRAGEDDCGYARSVHRDFVLAVEQMDPLAGLALEDIAAEQATAPAHGLRPSLFVSERTFEQLCRRQLSLLRPPVLECVDAACQALDRLFDAVLVGGGERSLDGSSLVPVYMQRFPRLRQRLRELCAEVLEECRQPTLHIVRSLVDIELACINAAHPDLWSCLRHTAPLASTTALSNLPNTPLPNMHSQEASSGLLSYLFFANRQPPSPLPSPTTPTAAATPAEKRPSVQMAEAQWLEAKLLRELVGVYVGSMRRKLADTVPKAIDYGLVREGILRKLSSHLVTALLPSSELAALLREDASFGEHRTRLLRQLAACRRALKIVSASGTTRNTG